MFALALVASLSAMGQVDLSLEDERRIEELLRAEVEESQSSRPESPRSVFEQKGGLALHALLPGEVVEDAGGSGVEIPISELADRIGDRVRITTFHAGEKVGVIEAVTRDRVTVTMRVNGQSATIAFLLDNVRRVETY